MGLLVNLKSKLFISGIVLVIFITIGMYIKSVIQENAILKSNLTQLNIAVEQQKKVVEQHKENFDEIIQSYKDVEIIDKQQQYNIQQLENRLTKSNNRLFKIAKNKPKLAEDIINNAAKNIIRCNMIALGDPILENEEVNTECPELFTQ